MLPTRRHETLSTLSIKKAKLKLYINMKTGSLDDPSGLAKDLESPVHIGHWGNGDYEVEGFFGVAVEVDVRVDGWHWNDSPWYA